MNVFDLHRGTAPLLISLPHDGSEIPAALAVRMTPEAQRAPDTDWHVSRLYAFARELGASILVPRCSRYVIDLNRPPDDVSLYPGQNTTGLCPTVRFSGDPVYLPHEIPAPDEIQARIDTYWRPYHAALASELARLKAVHGYALLFDAHSIKSALPWLFDGRLPDLNLGTASGEGCGAPLREALARVLQGQSRYTHAVDGRFKGGYITRHYGRPREGVQAVQLEMAWRCYMLEVPPYAIDEARASGVRPLLAALIEAMLAHGAPAAP